MKDREILRKLVSEYVIEAKNERNLKNAELYRALNRKKMIRPVVLMDEIPWNQLAGLDELKLLCEGERERKLEADFRKRLYQWRHFPCDMILPDYFVLGRHISIGSFGIEKQENILEYDQGNNIVSHHYIDQLADEEALEKLHAPEIYVDEEADQRDLEWLNGIFGDLLPVKLRGNGHPQYYKPWDEISTWRGVEPLLWDLVDRPEYSHAMVEKLLNIQLDLLDRMEQMNLLPDVDTYIHCTAGLADELPGDVKDGRITRKNLWGRGTAQIFATVSPRMTDEFEIEYAKRYFEGFGLVYYGCCEPLDKKLHVVKKLPNLRKISITPWADAVNAAEQIGDEYVMAHKPNPAFVAVDMLDEEAIRNEVKKVLEVSKRNNVNVEFTLKDISSVNYHPEHLDRWAQIVMGLVQE